MPSVGTLRKAALWDPRPREDAQTRPIHDAANIPLDELSARVHELPPKNEEVLIAAEGALADAANELLRRRGRVGRVVRFDHVEPGIPAAGRLWSPNSLLAEHADYLTPGRALDLGCGSGREAIFLAVAGWRVLAVDHLPEALERGRRSAEALLGNASAAIEWRCADVARVSPGEFGEAAFDLTTVLFLRNPRAFEIAAAALKPDGVLLYEGFDEAGWSVPDDDLAKIGTFHRAEASRNGRTTLRVVARNPAEVHPVTQMP